MRRRDVLDVFGATAALLVALSGPATFAQQREVVTAEPTETGYSWGGPFELWEFHPALNHVPIAFLLGGVALDLYAWWRGRPGLDQAATGLLVAGLITGVLSALTGVLAFFTVPAHTDEAHRLMYWHMVIQAAALVLFVWPAWKRWRNWFLPPSVAQRLTGCVALLLLLIGSGIGGYIVYHGGAGIVPELLAPELREGHSHEGHSTESVNVGGLEAT